MKKLAKKIRDANLRVFQSKDFDDYDSNESIFEESRQREIKSILYSRSGILLDVGCGTGNIIRLARDHFSTCIGLDVSHNLLRELNLRYGFRELATGEADLLPLKDGSVDMVSCYALLHHLFDHDKLFKEACRVLKPGGLLYVDHDPNYYFARFYNFYYRFRYMFRPGFEDRETEISEWHNTHSSGLHPKILENKMFSAGFSSVKVGYRLTSNPSLPLLFKIARSFMQGIGKIVRSKSFYTHFYMVAVK
jgi:ubiquinone/menaquinone biosynthesis C-methylase UbiE